MDWLQVVAIIGGNIAIIIPLFLWVRTEGNSDRRETQNIIREDRKDFLGIVRSIENEMKDFHNRLIKIEMERNK